MDKDLIIEKIQAKGLTKAHVAKMIGIDQATLSRVLAGKQTASSELTDKLAGYLEAVNSDDPSLRQK